MTFSIEQFLQKEYDSRNYNCWHFVCDAWAALTGQVYVADPIDKMDNVSYLHVKAVEMAGQFDTLEEPRSPCFVLLRRQRLAPHIGLYIKGNILHLNDRGAFYAPAHSVTAMYPTVSYHLPKGNQCP